MQILKHSRQKRIFHADRIQAPSREKRASQNWKNGRWSATRAQLNYIPICGYYRYKTNATMVKDWIIAGEMRILRKLGDSEVAEICGRYGLVPLEWLTK